MDHRNQWIALAGSSAAADSSYAELDRVYTDLQRAYHTWQHIDECLSALAAYETEHGDTGREIRFALFYHDAVYEIGARDNEARSADLARKRLADLHESGQLIERVAALVMATAHLSDAGATPDDRAPLMTDIDLAILGSDHTRFLEYDQQIRKEYAAVAEEEFRSRRGRVLGHFLQMESIYSTEFFRFRYEAQAHRNLRAAVADYQSQ